MIQKLYKISVRVVAVIVLLFIGIYTFYLIRFPRVGSAENIEIKANAEMIARGEYLANHVAVCMDCHSTRDWNYYSGPIKEGTLGKGGDYFDEKNAGIPGKITAKNITPFNLKDWTDGEIYRLITTGVTKSGKAIFPLMPYPAYKYMDPNDIKSIIAYLRTLHPISNFTLESNLNFPLNIIVKTIPSPPEPMTKPDESDVYNHGKYLTTIAACADCHSPAVKGKRIEGMDFAGGFEFKSDLFGTVRSSNITPDLYTGIGKWSEDEFIARFKFYAKPEGKKIQYAKGDIQTVMPWTMYAGMKESDLRAIYRYLRTVKPVSNKVTKYSPIARK